MRKYYQGHSYSFVKAAVAGKKINITAIILEAPNRDEKYVAKSRFVTYFIG